MPLHNRIAIVLALIALAFLAANTLVWPAHDVKLGGLSFTLSGNQLLGLIAIGLAWAGADAVMRSHPSVRHGQLRHPFLRCMLPAAVTAAAWVLLARLPALENRVLGIAATAGAVAVLIFAEYLAVAPAAAGRGALVLMLQFATYSAAALLYGATYLALPDVNAVRAATAVSAFLALRLLGDDELPLPRILWASAGIGLLLGATSWLLRPRTASTLTYSLTLLVFLYVLAGLARQFLRGKLRREVVLEYSLVGLAALLLLFFFSK